MGNISGSIIRLYLSVNGSNKIPSEETSAAGGDDDGNDRANGNGRIRHRRKRQTGASVDVKNTNSGKMTMMTGLMPPKGPAVARLSAEDVVGIVRHHPLPTLFTVSLLFFMGVEYTIRMVPFDSPPLDIGFIFTQFLHGFIAARPALNSLLAALNTVFVIMQAAYILWALLVEGRARPTIAVIAMFTCRGILGCATQLPLPQEFLGSGMDFPVGNVSFFLFFSGHVAGAVIASLDMRRMRRRRLAWAFDTLNALQGIRLLAARGHYTIDLAVGVGAGILFDSFAGSYERSKNHRSEQQREGRPCCGCNCG